MKRKIITIDDQLCNGCGQCIPNCPEGALRMIDNKARLISDLFCDGLGACIGHCPAGAITIEEREAEPYDEWKVMENIVRQGHNTVIAHLEHLRDHGESGLLKKAVEFLKFKGHAVPAEFIEKQAVQHHGGGCPGSQMRDFGPKKAEERSIGQLQTRTSELRQWPVQLTLLNPNAPYLKNADLVIAADCVPFALPDFHERFLKGKALAIFCPKLDVTLAEYTEKLTAIFQNQDIKSLTLVHMEVPCCFGLVNLVKNAMEEAGKNIPVTDKIVSIEGNVLN